MGIAAKEIPAAERRSRVASTKIAFVSRKVSVVVERGIVRPGCVKLDAWPAPRQQLRGARREDEVHLVPSFDLACSILSHDELERVQEGGRHGVHCQQRRRPLWLRCGARRTSRARAV